MDQQISDMIVDALIADLEDAFADIEADEAEIEQPGEIKGGRLQDNPVKKRISITVHLNDPEDPSGWEDNVLARRDHALDRFHFDSPAFEVGGGSMWWRRGMVNIDFYGIKRKEDRDESRRIANLIRGRAERAIALSQRIPGLKDVFGETVVKIMPVTSSTLEGGGPPKSFIWRVRIRWQAETNRNY